MSPRTMRVARTLYQTMAFLSTEVCMSHDPVPVPSPLSAYAQGVSVRALAKRALHEPLFGVVVAFLEVMLASGLTLADLQGALTLALWRKEHDDAP